MTLGIPEWWLGWAGGWGRDGEREGERGKAGWLETRWMHGSEERRSRRANRKKRER